MAVYQIRVEINLLLFSQVTQSRKDDFPYFSGGLIPREKVVLDKKEAFNFFNIFKDNIDHECYEEGCTFGEVVDHYGYSEESVGVVSFILISGLRDQVTGSIWICF